MIIETLVRIRRMTLSGLAVTGLLVASASAQEDQIVGTWNCTTSFEEEELGISMTADFESTYGADGTLARDGEMNMTIAALQAEVGFSVKTVGTWRLVEAMTIEETIASTEFAATSEEPSQIEQMMMQQMQAEMDNAGPQTETVELESLTETTMVGSSAVGAAVTCARA